MRGFFLAALLLMASAAQARIFNYKDSNLAMFLGGSLGTSQASQDAFANADGAAAVDKDTKYAYSGEFGVLLGLNENLRMRMGAEIIQHTPISKAPGLNASGAELFSLDSSIFVFNPNLVFEYSFKNLGGFRFFGEAGVGYAMVTASNSYAMTAAGTSAFGVSDYKEGMTGTAISSMAGVGMEMIFVDNTTFSLHAGYRHIPVKELKYAGDVKTISQPGGVSKGDTVLNSDGSKRALNLDDIFVGVTLRFFLHFL